MATQRTGPGAKRPQYGTGVFLSRVVAGQVVPSIWPRARPKRPDTYTASIRARFAAAVATVKRMHTRELQPLRDAITRHNAKHAGLSGSAAIRPEDYDQARLSGRLWLFILPGGRYSAHVDAIHDVTRLLDWTEPQVGSLLTRTAAGWRATSPCAPGARLRLTPDTLFSGCCPPAQIWPQAQSVPPS